jgi:manganese transport protein
VTRGIAIVPVIFVTALYGESGTAKLLVLSQVILSMQLPFAIVPLIQFVTDRERMGGLVISRKTACIAWIIAAIIIVLNVKLLFDTFVP